ncbi:MAG TPA: hypothetical protein VNJ08_04345 [Bacteriovoracaceae bacterium]|nr:hypothetical protein [Bacteriovoracaceae bacterium]
MQKDTEPDAKSLGAGSYYPSGANRPAPRQRQNSRPIKLIILIGIMMFAFGMAGYWLSQNYGL